MMRLANLHMNEFNSIQFNSIQFNSIAVTLNFIFLLTPAIFLIYYVYSLIVCYFVINIFILVLNFLKLILVKSILFLNAFYKYFNYRRLTYEIKKNIKIILSLFYINILDINIYFNLQNPLGPGIDFNLRNWYMMLAMAAGPGLYWKYYLWR